MNSLSTTFARFLLATKWRASSVGRRRRIATMYGALPRKLRLRSALISLSMSRLGMEVVCGLTFELSWRRRRDVLDSKRKMGRRPSA